MIMHNRAILIMEGHHISDILISEKATDIAIKEAQRRVNYLRELKAAYGAVMARPPVANAKVRPPR